jgi:hypothetical protein
MLVQTTVEFLGVCAGGSDREILSKKNCVELKMRLLFTLQIPEEEFGKFISSN